MTKIDIYPLTPERLPDYLAFFDTEAFTDNTDWDGCYCYFPYNNPQESEWSERTAQDNQNAISHCVMNGEAGGFLAYEGDKVVGWCNAAPRALYPTLARLPGDPHKIGAIPCFLIAPNKRGQGIATMLLDAACNALQNEGMQAVIAKPVREAQSAAGHSGGPLTMYLNAGFVIVGEDPHGNVFVEKRFSMK